MDHSKKFHRFITKLSVLAPLSCLQLLFTITPVIAAWSDPPDVPATLCNIEFIFSRGVTAIVALIGLAAFMMLISGGFKLITSGGDAKAADQAHGTITFAVIGLALLVGGVFILKFLQFFTGVDLLNFVVCKP